jgi:3-deoxy-D-manno-octulosonate 8-phosphate phosphatase (KDO 8-P phosphatase)
MSVRLFVLDVDGVMTDGTILYTADGETIKPFHAQDGLGLALLMKLGVSVAVISGRTSKPLERRLDDLGIRHRRLKCKNKVVALEDICADLGLTLGDVAFMGDDLIDLEAMEASAYSIAPANAVEPVRVVADLVTKKEGGHGAVREACEHLALKMGHNLEAVARGNKKVWVQ